MQNKKYEKRDIIYFTIEWNKQENHINHEKALIRTCILHSQFLFGNYYISQSEIANNNKKKEI